MKVGIGTETMVAKRSEDGRVLVSDSEVTYEVTELFANSVTLRMSNGLCYEYAISRQVAKRLRTLRAKKAPAA